MEKNGKKMGDDEIPRGNSSPDESLSLSKSRVEDLIKSVPHERKR